MCMLKITIKLIMISIIFMNSTINYTCYIYYIGHQRNKITYRFYTEYFQLIIRIICVNVLGLLI